MRIRKEISLEVQKVFADRVRYRMTLLGLLPNQLASKSGISAATIYRILGGDVQLRTESLVKLADALHTSIDYLSGRTPDQTAEGAIQVDKNAGYIFDLYGQMNASQMQQLVQFAEFVRYRAFNMKDLLKSYSELYEFCIDSIKANTWDKKDQRFRQAEEQMAAAAITFALEQKGEKK